MTAELTMLQSQCWQVRDLTSDSRKVQDGALFLAYPGERTDGRAFIAQAIAQGAAAVLWEREGFAWDSSWQVPNLPMDDLRLQTGFIADEFRSEERRVGKECVSTCRSRWSLSH